MTCFLGPSAIFRLNIVALVGRHRGRARLRSGVNAYRTLRTSDVNDDVVRDYLTYSV